MELKELKEAKAHAKASLGHLEGVQGFGIGDDAIRAYVRDTSCADALPDDVNGVPIEVVIVGDISAAKP
jgi:hypothetical protein